MKFKATPDQVKQIAANAVNASAPMGMGVMHYLDKTYLPEEFDFNYGGGIYLDYHDGRMTKLTIHRSGSNWEVSDGKPQEDYQSWAKTYPTYEALITSVEGVEVL